MSEDSSDDSDDGILGGMGGIFQEDDEYFKKDREPQTEEVSVGEFSFTLRVVGEHSLWGNYVWNAARCISSEFVKDPSLVVGKRILELGAGACLPSIVATKLGASYVLCTDYPEKSLVDNMDHNLRANLSDEELTRVTSRGFFWGDDVGPLFLDEAKTPFDIVIMSDLIFNHSGHDDLITIALKVLRPDGEGVVHVTFSHHTPIWKDRDMRFFEIARERGLEVKLIDRFTYREMFPDDPGDLELRRTVFRYELRRGEEEEEEEEEEL